MTVNDQTIADFRVATNDGGHLVGDVRGRADGPTVVLVHGYPDTSRVWGRVAEHLAATCRVVRFDVRGAGGSFAPRATSNYALPRLTDDIGAVIDSLSPDTPVHLVGHDWGAIQGWEAVSDPSFGQRIASFTTISGPCLDHVGHWLRACAGNNPGALAAQLRQSWYIGAFHLPGLPSVAWRTLSRWWPSLLAAQEGVRPEPDPDQAASGRRGVALYRANILPRLLRPRDRATEVPVQTIVPTLDRYVSQALADTAAPWVTHRRRVAIEAGHWLPLSHPAWLVDRIQEFIAQATSADPPAAAARTEFGRESTVAPFPVNPTEAAQ